MAVHLEGARTLQQLVESWRAPGLILRADTSAELVNASLCTAAGLEQERLVGFGWLGIIHHGDPGAAPAFWGTRMAAGERFGAEIKLRRYDGSFLPVHADATPLGDGRWFLTMSELQRPAIAATREPVLSDDALRALMFEHTREAVFAWELEGRPRILVWNRAAEQLYGYSMPEVVGRSPHVVLRTAFPISFAHMEAALRRDGRWSGELRHTTRDGTILTIDAALVLVRLGDGRSIVLESARDVTGRRRDEHAALEASARLRLALAAARMGIWEWHVATHRVYWSPEACELLGLEPAASAAPMLDDFRRLVHPDDAARLREEVERALDGARGFDCELRVVRADGAVRWLHTRALVDRDAAGAPSRLVGTMRDVTAERELTERLAASEARFRALANAMPQVAWICDAALRTEWVNDRFVELTGVTLAALQEGAWHGVVHPDDAARLGGEWPAASSGDARELELRLRCGEGYRWFLARAVPVRDASGAAVRWFSTATDIDDRKRMEAALRDSEEAARARAAELSTILEATPAAVWITRDPEAREIEGSRAGYEMLRSSPGRNLSKTGDDSEAVAHFSVWSNGVELAPHELPLQRAARGEALHGFVEEVRFSDGAVRHIYGNAVPLHHADGSLRGAVAAFIDVTPLHAAGAPAAPAAAAAAAAAAAGATMAGATTTGAAAMTDTSSAASVVAAADTDPSR